MNRLKIRKGLVAALAAVVGPADLLRRHEAWFRATLAHVAAAISPDGAWTAGKFLDWPNQHDPQAVAAGMQGLLAARRRRRRS